VNGIECIYTPAVEKKRSDSIDASFFSMVTPASRCRCLIFVVNSGNGPFGLNFQLFGKPTVIMLTD